VPAIIPALVGDRSGATATETAIVLPLAILFLLGIFQLGCGIYCGDDVRHAIERGSRIYISDPAATSDQLSTAVASNLTTVKINSITLTATDQTVSGAAMKNVAWTYSYALNLPFMSNMNLNFDSSIVVPKGAG
jgi:Flp pilus assembly protein TadG